MARPVKDGIDYFPLDVHLNEEFELIEAEFGLIGFAVVVKLLQKIYGGKGYYCEWTNDVALLFGKKCGFKPGDNVVSEIVRASINRGIFNRKLYDEYQILTSKGIQERYFEAISRRKKVEVEKAYLLVDVTQFLNNVHINGVNVDINTQKANNNSQTKVNKTKVKESRVNETIPPISPRRGSVPYKEIVELYNTTCTRLPKVTTLNDSRRRAVRVMFDKYGIDGFRTVFAKANESGFLTGSNKTGWVASFDWLMKDANFVKVSEDVYANRQGNGHTFGLAGCQTDYNEIEKIIQGKL